MPNFARWMTVFPALDLFLDNWTIIYFIAVAIKQTLPSTSSLSQYASTFIGLMNTASGPPRAKLSEGRCPVLYAKGLFVCAFGNAYFARHFEWLLRSDPEFGSDSYGQSIWLYVERCYLMRRDLDELVDNDGWKLKPEFADYIEAIETMPDLGDKIQASKSFFIKDPTFFVNAKSILSSMS